MTDVFTRLSILTIALVGVLMGVVWLFLRPATYRRSLEAVSQTRSPRIPKFITVGLAGITIATLALVALSIRSDRFTREKVQTEMLNQTARADSHSAESGDALTNTSLPESFESEYAAFKRPLRRLWKRNVDGTWTEFYAGQVSNVFVSEGAVNVDGCLGLLLSKRGESGFEVFLPSSGCKQLLKYRWEGSAWRLLGYMESPATS